MAAKRTPLMRQYREIKSRHQDGILLFQVGDFYETFYEDAREISRLLGIALTTRDRGRENPIPLAGVPVHAAESYIARLLRAGKKVIVCDQADDAPGPGGVVERRVTDVVTPGTTLSPSTLVESENNFIAAFVPRGERCGIALLDLSTGEFAAGEETTSSIERAVAGVRVREAIQPEDAPGMRAVLEALLPGCAVSGVPAHLFDETLAREALERHFAVHGLAGFGLDDLPAATAAAGSLLAHVKGLRRSECRHIAGIRLITAGENLFLDAETIRNLEIFEPLRGDAPDATLIHHIDRTGSALGARELRRWILHPLRSPEAIASRQDGIAALAADGGRMRAVRGSVRRLPDIERLLARITARTAGPRELLSLGEALDRVPAIAEAASALDAAIIREAVSALRTPLEAAGLIRAGISPDCAAHCRDGGVIRRGYSPELDRLIEESEAGKGWIASLQESERRRTGIASLKVGYNRVFGYYIDVSRVHDEKIPPDYIRKQTLVSSQRYVTPALEERERAILAAEERRIDLEKELFAGLCDRIALESASIQAVAKAAALVDCLSSLADLALERSYCRPTVDESGDLIIVEGRHPVVEMISGKSFIPNDLEMPSDGKRFLVITGPNMGGKSTYIRQAALIAILAHAGSFVPASRASIGVLDRIFTRVGSSDNVARGQSTFLVEMAETAKILHNCTPRSLVILDEVGRGTSTLDGLSIAWAVSEFLSEDAARAPKTLFATHYHELTHLAAKHPLIGNLRVEVKEWGDSIIFLYKISPGASDRSYGIHVAKLAGLPSRVTLRAQEILESLENGGRREPPPSPAAPSQMTLFADRDPIRERLHSIDINSVTPMDALKILDELRRLSGRG